MGCCGSKNSEAEVDEVKSDLTTAPVRKEGCTDLFFLLIFIVALGGTGFIAFRAVQQGDPGRLIYGTDSWGNVCGRKENLRFPDVENAGFDRSNHTKELNLLFSDLSLIINPKNALSDDRMSARICVHKCPDELTKCSEVVQENGYNVKSGILKSRICRMAGRMILPHTSIFNRCVPTQIVTLAQEIADASVAAGLMTNNLVANQSQIATNVASKSATYYIQRVIDSVIKNWKQILYLILLSVGVSLGIIVLLQLFTRVLVITILVLAGFGTFAVSSYLWYLYMISIGVIDEGVMHSTVKNITKLATEFFGMNPANGTFPVFNVSDVNEALWLQDLYAGKYLLPAAIAATIFTLIAWIILIWTRKSLALVVSLFDEASLALFTMPGILFQPFVSMIFLLAILAGFVVLSFYILTDQTPKVDEDGLVYFVYQQDILRGKYLFVPVVFMTLWLLEFGVACHQIILAGAISQWFFTRGTKKCKINLCPTCRPTYNLVLYNLGSAAIGSLIVALIQFLRIILAYVHRKLKRANNQTANFIMKCLSCCLLCIEKVIKYVNRNAYICIAMYGESFCSSARKALALLISNYTHVLALNCMSNFCLLLGSVAVVGVTGVIAAYWFRVTSVTELDLLAPVIISCLGALFVSRCFLSLFGMAIDTIFLCFCDDHQRNNGDDRPYYSSKGLQKFMTTGLKNSKKAPASSAGMEKATKKNERPHVKQTKVKKLGENAAARRTQKKRIAPSYTRSNIPNHRPVNNSVERSNRKIYPLPGQTFTLGSHSA